MSPTQTCAACRSRKVRCDGVQPICGPCSKARKPIECVYTTATVPIPKSEYLKKGAACVPCRRKKKKCDAKRPFCSKCQVAGKEDECNYDEGVERTLTEALLLRTHLLEQRLAAYESQVGAAIVPDRSVSAHLTGYPQPVASTSRLPPPNISQQDLYNIPMYNFPHALTVLFDCLSAPAPTTDIHSISAPRAPLGLEEFRTTFGEHARQYGCILPSEKMQAILVGDLSGTIVHPAFVYMAQLLGCLMWQIARHTHIFQSIESEQLQLLFATLDDIGPIAEIQIRYLLGIYYLVRQQIEDGQEQLVLAVDIVRRHNLTFPTSPDTFDPLATHEVTAEQAEHISALAHLIYLDRASSFVFRVPIRLDKSYDDALKNVSLYYPIWTKTNLAYIRARSLILSISAMDLSTRWASINASASGGMFSPARPAWFDAYWPLLEDITSHSGNIESEMLKASFYGEREQGVALKMCLVVSLSGKAQLHWLVRHGHPESMQRALDAVMEVVGITRTFKDNEFVLLDPVLGVCWSTIAQIVVEAMKGYALTVDKEGVSWTSVLQTIDVSAKKLGYQIPFMDESLQVISKAIQIVDA